MREVPVIETKGLTIGYQLKGNQQRIVHEELDLQLSAGKVTCLLGLNGAGKSTLLRTLCGFQPALKGKINLLGKPLDAYSRIEFSTTVGVVLTEKTNAGGITVYDLVSLGRHPYTGFWGILHQEDKDIIEQSMEAVGISHKSANYVSELSDGEKQKAMIAKVLAQQCPVILLDEPTAFLDVTSRIETMALLHRLAIEQQKAILLSTHDLDLAIQMADCLWLLSKDRPTACGSPEDLILKGAFTSFFDRGQIQFDQATGKLNLHQTDKPIEVSGNQYLTFWIQNALKRNGYSSSLDKASNWKIACVSSTSFHLINPAQQIFEFNSVDTLIAELKNLYP